MHSIYRRAQKFPICLRIFSISFRVFRALHHRHALPMPITRNVRREKKWLKSTAMICVFMPNLDRISSIRRANQLHAMAECGFSTVSPADRHRCRSTRAACDCGGLHRLDDVLMACFVSRLLCECKKNEKKFHTKYHYYRVYAAFVAPAAIGQSI